MQKLPKIIHIILLLGIGIPSVSAQSKKESLKVLFVGNSYTYFENLPQIVTIISKSTNTQLVTKKSTLGGAKLSEHWRGARGLKTKEIITHGKFDMVVLQEQSMGTLAEKDSVKKYTRLFCDFIRAHGAKPYIYLTWARENAPQNQEIMNQVFSEIGIENKAELVSAGKAWALARQNRPELKLYDADGSHPSKLGTFLTACVFVKTLLHQLPAGIPNAYYTEDKEKESVMLMHVDTSYVSFCKKIVERVSVEESITGDSKSKGVSGNKKSSVPNQDISQ